MDSGMLRIDNSLRLQIPDADIPERQRKAEEVMFADMISVGDVPRAEDFTADVMDEVVGNVESEPVDTRREKPADAYEKYQYKDKTIRTESKTVTEQDAEKVEAEVTEFTENVTEVIREELHVSKEEIEAAMEELGLTFMDLLDAGNLANLVAKLSGSENTNQLLCSEVFTNILTEVNELGTALCEELQMTPEELELIQQELAQMTVSTEEAPVEQTLVSETETVEVVDADDTAMVKQTNLAENPADSVENTTEHHVVVEEVSMETSTEESFSGQMSDSEEEMPEQKTTAGDTKQVLQAAEPKAENVVSVDASVTGSIMEQLGSVETVQGLPSYVSVADIMEQFVEQTRVLVSQEATKMEMQLNPEHLGKLYVEIIEQEGAVTAKIQTQNAIVKEALEMQIADLRQNLSQVGVKVDAVEVTIASHEFERNLEQDTNGQKQQDDAEPKAARMRNINLNELDGLSGLMTEEETIVAKMMAEQGNSVNFTA